MQTKEDDSTIIVRLNTDENIISALKNICINHKVDTAVVLSALGQIKKFRLGFFNGREYVYHNFENTHELLSISGMISYSAEKNDCQLHLHAVVGDSIARAFGGHLVEGIVESTNEIVLLKTAIKVKRKIDPQTGPSGLLLE